MKTRSLFAAALVIGLASCSAVVDLDRFYEQTSQVSQGTTGIYDNLELTFLAMKPHVGQMFEYRVIDSNNMVQSRGVVKPVGPTDITINVPLAVPKTNGPYRLDFYADVNASGGFDGIGSVISNDHAWRVDPLADYPAGNVTHVDGLIQVNFVHNTSFTDINQYPSGTPNPAKDTGLSAAIHVVGANELTGQMFQVRVAEATTQHVVALFRLPVIASVTFDAIVPGCVDTGVDYIVEAYVDANGNGTYDNPATGAGDYGWRVAATSNNQGLSASVDISDLPSGKVDVGPP
jgi:hypothetical protein